MGKDPGEIREAIEATRGRMGDTVEALSYKTDVKARTKDAIDDKKQAVVGKVTAVKDAIVGGASNAADTVGGVAPSSEDVKQTAKRAASVAQQNPLGLALGAAALGFLAGMLVPATRFEDEAVGQAADQVKDTIKDTGQQALEHGKQVAQDVVQAAGETAKESGQEHADQLKQTALDNADEAASTMSSATREGALQR